MAFDDFIESVNMTIVDLIACIVMFVSIILSTLVIIFLIIEYTWFQHSSKSTQNIEVEDEYSKLHACTGKAGSLCRKDQLTSPLIIV